MTTLLTGAAGFIGAAVAEALVNRGERVVGLDNLNAYYDPALKQARLARLQALPGAQAGGFVFHQLDLENTEAIAALFSQPPSARKDDASPTPPHPTTRGLDGAEQCVVTARRSKLM